MLQNKKYSIVIPIFNEEENLKELHRRLALATNSRSETCEIIFVSDGSTDSSMEIMKTLRLANENIRILELSRNFGHQMAITAGLQHSTGEAVIVMDGDLQDPPEIIPDLIDKWQEGYDVVFAIRRKREENIIKKMAYKLFYRCLKFMADVDIPLDAGDFSLMDRKVVDLINSMPEKNRFIRGLRAWVGFQQTSVAYDRDCRFSGEVKYTLPRLIKLALDGMLSFSYLPLRMVSITGMIVSVFGFVGIIIMLYLRLFTEMTVPGTTSIIVLILLLGGLQLFSIGIGWEYIGRIYDEVKCRPQFIVKNAIGFKEKEG